LCVVSKDLFGHSGVIFRLKNQPKIKNFQGYAPDPAGRAYNARCSSPRIPALPLPPLSAFQTSHFHSIGCVSRIVVPGPWQLGMNTVLKPCRDDMLSGINSKQFHGRITRWEKNTFQHQSGTQGKLIIMVTGRLVQLYCEEGCNVNVDFACKNFVKF